MDRKISYEEAEELLRTRLSENKNLEGLFNHSRAVADFLYDVCVRLNKLHPELNIDSEKMRIVGLLHDIGKNGVVSDILHPFTGANILREEGLGELGKIVETHSSAMEVAEEKGFVGEFEPKSLEEELLTYADSHIKHDMVVSFDERFNDLLERSKKNPERYKMLVLAKIRIEKIIDKIDGLLEN